MWPLYHPDVRAYEVRDAGGHVGVFLADHYARPDKRSGAWMSSFRDQEAMDAPVSPIIVNNNNFAKASPTLLSFDDAETLFHEFGHALHGLLSRVRYPGAVRHIGAARFRRVAIADLRALGRRCRRRCAATRAIAETARPCRMR